MRDYPLSAEGTALTLAGDMQVKYEEYLGGYDGLDVYIASTLAPTIIDYLKYGYTPEQVIGMCDSQRFYAAYTWILQVDIQNFLKDNGVKPDSEACAIEANRLMLEKVKGCIAGFQKEV